MDVKGFVDDLVDFLVERNVLLEKEYLDLDKIVDLVNESAEDEEGNLMEDTDLAELLLTILTPAAAKYAPRNVYDELSDGIVNLLYDHGYPSVSSPYI